MASGADHLRRVGRVVSRRVAEIRLRVDSPSTACFFDVTSALRIDLLFDFPVSAAVLSARATRLKVRAQVLDVASEADLLHLKEIAVGARSAPGDAEDLAFLRARQSQG